MNLNSISFYKITNTNYIEFQNIIITVDFLLLAINHYIAILIASHHMFLGPIEQTLQNMFFLIAVTNWLYIIFGFIILKLYDSFEIVSDQYQVI